jgi:hypothetical protein
MNFAISGASCEFHVKQTLSGEQSFAHLSA